MYKWCVYKFYLYLSLHTDIIFGFIHRYYTQVYIDIIYRYSYTGTINSTINNYTSILTCIYIFYVHFYIFSERYVLYSWQIMYLHLSLQNIFTLSRIRMFNILLICFHFHSFERLSFSIYNHEFNVRLFCRIYMLFNFMFIRTMRIMENTRITVNTILSMLFRIINFFHLFTGYLHFFVYQIIY